MKIRLVVSLLLILVSFNANAQKKAKISGIVSDSQGNPIETATVYIQGTIIGGFTNDKGFYSLSVNTGDSCTLVFTSIGYNKTQKRIASVGGDMTVNVQMNSISIELGGVEVKANRIQTNTMDKLDASKARLAVDPSGNGIESMLSTFAGVTSTNELSSQYSVRGGNYDENIVYVNGTEVYRPLLIRSGQQEGLSFINPDLTAAVSFSSGGYEAQYGDKMSSVLDIIYKKPQALEGSVSASLLGGTAYLGTNSKKFTQVTGFRYKSGRTLLNTLDTKGGYDPTYIDLQTYMTYVLTPKMEVNFLGNFSQNAYNFYPEERTTSFGTLQEAMDITEDLEGAEKDNFRTMFGALALKYALTKNTELGLKASAFQSQEKETYDIKGEYWVSEAVESEEETGETIGIGRYQYYARNRLHAEVMNLAHTGIHRFTTNTLIWGLSYQREIIDDRISEWEARDSLGYSLPYNGETVNVYDNLYSKNKISSSRFSGYLQDTYKFHNKLGLFSLVGGIRGSYWDFNKEFIFSPRASIGFVPEQHSNLTLRFATGLYYQAPFYKEFQRKVTDENGNSTIELNENIKSQRSIHFVLGGDYGFHMMERPFKFTTEVYYKKLDDLVPYTVNNVKIRYLGENVANGHITGIDMKIFGEFVQGTDSWLCFSLMQARQNINGNTVPLPTDQRYNISLFFTDYFPNYDRIKLNLKAIWSGGLPFSSPGHEYEYSYRSSDYRRVDIGMSYLLLGEDDPARDRKGLSYLKNVWIGLDAFNLLDIKNVNSYFWFSDVNNIQRAVPNYLTGRQLNVRLLVEF